MTVNTDAITQVRRELTSLANQEVEAHTKLNHLAYQKANLQAKLTALLGEAMFDKMIETILGETEITGKPN